MASKNSFEIIQRAPFTVAKEWCFNGMLGAERICMKLIKAFNDL